MKQTIPGLSPLPAQEPDNILLAHGSGGRMSARLIESMMLPRFGNPELNLLEDQAVLAVPGGRLAFSTDAFVVRPIFFPGGTIGDLAVNGTVNDVCVSGARPLCLSASFIIEEGLAMADLAKVLDSMAEAARAAGVRIVTGDTKVVDKGACDQLFITTSGIGVLPPDRRLGAAAIRPGDAIIVSGTMGDHGMAIMTTRKGLSFASSVTSDSAALNGLVEVMFRASTAIHAMRDPTRGGLAATLNELAAASATGMIIDETAVPVRPEVRAACEILGIDPMNVANEGKLAAFLPREEAPKVVEAMRSHPLGRDAAIIGRVTAENPGMVIMRTALGAERVVDTPLGEQLPRIC